MAANTAGDSDSSWEERVDEGPINPFVEAKRLSANLATPLNVKIARERFSKIQTSPAGKNRNVQRSKKKQLFNSFKNKIAAF